MQYNYSMKMFTGREKPIRIIGNPNTTVRISAVLLYIPPVQHQTTGNNDTPVLTVRQCHAGYTRPIYHVLGFLVTGTKFAEMKHQLPINKIRNIKGTFYKWNPPRCTVTLILA